MPVSALNKRARMALLASVALSAATVLVCCSKLSPDVYWQSDKFILIAVDSLGQMSLAVEGSGGMSTTIVGPTIFAVGSDNRYIVLKQHPATDKFGDFNQHVTLYFVVDRRASAGQSESGKLVLGPLSESEFTKLSGSRSLPAFTKTFSELQ